MTLYLEDEMSNIKKANFIKGRTLIFRDVLVDDAEFILRLRLDSDKSKYLSSVSQSLSDQVYWIEDYKGRDDQAYFIIEHENLKIGTVRLYDGRENSFCWGSWILVDDAPVHAALESALIVYRYALSYLGFHSSHFDVRKENKKVCQFHEKFGALKIDEDDLNNYYILNYENINHSLIKYNKYLNNLEVKFI
jgi:RimJ/RimL family protein N-acetyltransferase